MQFLIKLKDRARAKMEAIAAQLVGGFFVGALSVLIFLLSLMLGEAKDDDQV